MIFSIKTNRTFAAHNPKMTWKTAFRLLNLNEAFVWSKIIFPLDATWNGKYRTQKYVKWCSVLMCSLVYFSFVFFFSFFLSIRHVFEFSALGGIPDKHSNIENNTTMENANLGACIYNVWWEKGNKTTSPSDNNATKIRKLNLFKSIVLSQYYLTVFKCFEIFFSLFVVVLLHKNCENKNSKNLLWKKKTQTIFTQCKKIEFVSKANSVR